MKFAFLASTLALSLGAFGKNDWSKACLNGACSYDIEESPTNMGGTIEISGSPTAISDITPAAGWQILNCTSNTNNQTFSLVCADETLGCGHIFQNGAQDTIIRLPENCGSGPFVRVANHWIPSDQSLPAAVASNLTTSNGTIPQVHMLEIDDDFEKASQPHGDVSFEIQAQGDLHDISSGAKQKKRQNGSGFQPQSVNIPQGLQFVLFNDSLSCSSSQGTSTRTMDGLFTTSSTASTINMSISLVSRGTLNPPSITSLTFSAPTNASIFGRQIASLNSQGTTQKINNLLVNLVFAPFSINGIVTINPSFVIVSNVFALVQRQANFNPVVDFAYNINNLQFTYPTNSPPATVQISTPSSFYDLSALPDENGNAQMGWTTNYKLLADVTAFAQFVELSLSYTAAYDMEVSAMPASGNSAQVCFGLSNNFTVQAANSGPFYQAFGGASSLTIFEAGNTIVNSCEVVPLAPSPPNSRLARKSLYGRDSVSCPPPATTPLQTLDVTGSFP